MVIGKELIIRKALSPSHLYSSAFIIETEKDSSGTPVRFTLKGAGWGHGVGLCQIGAAVMSAKGYNYKEILTHYFPGTKIKTIENGELKIENENTSVSFAATSSINRGGAGDSSQKR